MNTTATLFKHQSEGVEFILKNSGCGALFWEIGCGKTRGALEIYSRLRTITPGLKLLVICPVSLIEGAWGEDIKKFTNYSYCNLREKFIPEKDIYIVNFEAFISERRTEEVKALAKNHPFMAVIDESSRIKNPKAQTTKTILTLRDLFLYRVPMSGTPAPNSETEFWAHMVFVKRGIFHEKFFPFRNHYFHLQREKRNGETEYRQSGFTSKAAARETFSQGWYYALTPQMRAALVERMRPWCHYAKKAECLDLPEQTDEIRIVEMGAKQRSYYNGMKEDLIVEIADSCVVAQVALAKILKLREICSGFAIDENGKSVTIGENPKLKELQNVLEELGKAPAIIWGNFQYEIEQIKEMLGDRAVTLYGGTKDRDESIRAFKSYRADVQGSGAQYLIANPHSAGHGLTFVNCSTEIFYSLDYSHEYHEQARGRIHRAGQVNKCTYIYLICRDSIEEELLRVLREKKEAVELVYRMTRRLVEVGV